MRLSILIISVGLVFFLVGCSGSKTAAFKTGDANPEVLNFFIGRTRSAGVVENRGGKPVIHITTETQGTLKDGVIGIEQDLYPEGQKKNHRTFKLFKIDEHHIEATASDIAGTAHGSVYGNEFSWTFRRKMENRKVIKHVRMSQTMYLMPDGKTMIIRSVIRKFGRVVAQITESFQKY